MIAEAAAHWHTFADLGAGIRAWPDLVTEDQARGLADELFAVAGCVAVWVHECPAGQGCMFSGTAGAFDPAQDDPYRTRRPLGDTETTQRVVIVALRGAQGRDGAS